MSRVFESPPLLPAHWMRYVEPMDRQFWNDSWEKNEIGFHLDHPNSTLVEHWDALGLQGNERVLVPLCGKSVDLQWLSEQGHSVLGVEQSPRAVSAFFENLPVTVRCYRQGKFEIWEAGRIQILCGDFFDLDARTLSGVSAVYDRAALIALPAAMRKRYAATLREHLAAPVRMLTITLEYDQSEMDGPPFSVAGSEVEALFGDLFEIDVLQRTEADVPPRFAERGMTRLGQVTYRLER